MFYNAIILCLALPLPQPPNSILVKKHSIWGLDLSPVMHNYSLLPKYSLCVSSFECIFFLWQPYLSPFPPSQLLLILQDSACSLLPSWHFIDGSQQNWSVSVFSQHFVQASIKTINTLACSDLTLHVSLPFEIALSSSLPSHIKANKQKPVSPLSGNFTWSWQPFVLFSICLLLLALVYLFLLPAYLSL